MKIRLKNDLRKGAREIWVPKSYDAEIIDREDHPIYGIRYKVKGYDDWFELNTFEWIEDTNDDFIRQLYTETMLSQRESISLIKHIISNGGDINMAIQQYTDFGYAGLIKYSKFLRSMSIPSEVREYYYNNRKGV